MRSPSQPDEADALILINGSREDASVTIPDDDGPLWNLAWDSAWESPAEHTEDLLAPGSATQMSALTMRLYVSAV